MSKESFQSCLEALLSHAILAAQGRDEDPADAAISAAEAYAAGLAAFKAMVIPPAMTGTCRESAQ